MNEPVAKTEEVFLKLLVVDDSDDDVFLLEHTLRKGGLAFAHTHVETLSDLEAALTEAWDVVITDHHMIGFSSKDVLDMVRARYQELPVVIVSGEIGEDVAVGEMHRGAQDYIMKDNLARLIPVILREYRQHESTKALRKTEEDYTFLRYHDKLTNLVNRQEFEVRLGQAIEKVKASRETNVLLFLDLDQFKVVNDTCGHIAGDELLVKTTEILKSCIKEKDTLARLGGDEFGILLDNCNKQDALNVAQQIRLKVKANRFVWSGVPFEVSISIGVVEINSYTPDIHELLSCADIACYAAKDKGRDGIVLFTPSDEEYTKRKSEMRWAPKIRQAAAEDRFVLYHQPMQNLKAGDDGHTEFLLRLQDGKGGFIPPGEFIPAAERYNLMPVIDRWVVRHVFEYLHRAGLGQKEQGTYFINLSGSTLSDQSFFDDIRHLQQENAILPPRICFEITETAAIDNLVDAVDFIAEIRQLGFKFALDDFGVGLSSFSYLKTIPVDYLKIDGSFVLNMLENSIDRGIVEACNKIAHAAGLVTIAEFVETKEIIQGLKEIGVDYAQGYGVERPGPLPDIKN